MMVTISTASDSVYLLIVMKKMLQLLVLHLKQRYLISLTFFSVNSSKEVLLDGMTMWLLLWPQCIPLKWPTMQSSVFSTVMSLSQWNMACICISIPLTTKCIHSFPPHCMFLHYPRIYWYVWNYAVFLTQIWLWLRNDPFQWILALDISSSTRSLVVTHLTLVYWFQLAEIMHSEMVHFAHYNCVSNYILRES